MTTGLTYSTYVSQIATMAVVNGYDLNDPTDPFTIILPQMITYAENRICRDLDFLSTQNANTYTMTSGNNQLTIPTGDFITIQTVAVTSGTANLPVLPVTKEYIQNVYNDSSSTGIPTVFAVYGGDRSTTGLTSQYLIFGPYPSQNYSVLVTGTSRPASLSSTNTATFISTYLPDVLIMVSMIYISAYQRNFGRANDDPQMAMTYESQYNALLKSAFVEEARKKFQSAGWTSYSPSQAASPTRG
jgi:hypothetical protein